MIFFLVALFGSLLGAGLALLPGLFDAKRKTYWGNSLLQDAEKQAKKLLEEKREFLSSQEKDWKQKLEKQLLDSKNLQQELRIFEGEKKRFLEEKEGLYQKVVHEIDRSVRDLKEKRNHYLKSHSEIQAISAVVSAINRLNLPELQTLSSEFVLVEEEMRGRLVGKEGKNIQCLQHLLDVRLVIDRQLGGVFISSLDPEKRFLAKHVIAHLIEGGKVFPEKIEEAFQVTKRSLPDIITSLGKEEAQRIGVENLPSPIANLLGKLSFRYSLGQNLLDHSIEVGLILSNLARELHLEENLAKRIGLLHDIGKALPNSGTSHALAGMAFAKLHGEPDSVANGIGCHHFEVAPLTQEGALCHIADALSAGKKGARI